MREMMVLQIQTLLLKVIRDQVIEQLEVKTYFKEYLIKRGF